MEAHSDSPQRRLSSRLEPCSHDFRLSANSTDLDCILKIRTLLRSRASEPCSLVIKVRALNAHAPTLTFPGARTRCSRPSIGTVFVCDNDPSIQRTGDFLVVLSRYPSHQYQYGCVIVLLLLAIHKDIRLIFISPL